MWILSQYWKGHMCSGARGTTEEVGAIWPSSLRKALRRIKAPMTLAASEFSERCHWSHVLLASNSYYGNSITSTLWGRHLGQIDNHPSNEICWLADTELLGKLILNPRHSKLLRSSDLCLQNSSSHWAKTSQTFIKRGFALHSFMNYNKVTTNNGSWGWHFLPELFSCLYLNSEVT